MRSRVRSCAPTGVGVTDVSSAGNGHDLERHHCRFDGSHVFTTMSARMSHEPSCPGNPDRVDERENPEREV